MPRTISDNVILQGTLNVNGAVDLDSTLNVDGLATVEQLQVDQNAFVSADMDVVGNTLLNQNNASGNVSPLTLMQSDLSEEMIEFSGTVATGNPIEAVGAKTLTVTHFVRVSINGTLRYLPVGTIA